MEHAATPGSGAVPAEPPPWKRMVRLFWTTAALVLLAFLVLRVAAQAFLLTFAGILFGAGLRGAAAWLSRALRWPVGWSLFACVALLAALAVGAGFWIVPHVADQAADLAAQLQSAWEVVRDRASRSGLSRWWPRGGGEQLGPIALRAAGILATAAGAAGAFVYVFFVALYTAGSPDVYRRGVLRLVAPPRRARIDEVLVSLGVTLRRWLLGRLVSMTAVGVATTLGLWLLGIPLPVTLGLIAGVLGFVPNIGPIVSAVPALLLAFTVSPMHAVYVLALYLAINTADGYGLTPWVQKRAVEVPPALTLTAQVLFGAFWGVLGITLATPLLACLVVAIRALYVEDRLERTPT
jgi:predicted PurR-regulated permease PerM